MLSTGYLPRGGLPRNSVDRITDRPDMISAVDRKVQKTAQGELFLYEKTRFYLRLKNVQQVQFFCICKFCLYANLVM